MKKVDKVVLKVLSKPGCGPCSTSAFILKRLQKKYEFEFSVINISERRYKQYSKFGVDLPVILNGEDDEVLAKNHINQRHIEQVLKDLGAEKGKNLNSED